MSDSHICAESGRGCLLLPMHHTHARARSPRHRQRQSLRLSLSQSHKQKTRKPMAVPPHPLHTPPLDTTPQSPTVTHPSPRPLPHSLAPHRCPLDGVTSSVAWGFEARWSQLITPLPASHSPCLSPTRCGSPPRAHHLVCILAGGLPLHQMIPQSAGINNPAGSSPGLNAGW